MAEVNPNNKGTRYLVPFSIILLIPLPSDKTILVPLTTSLYVPGKLSDPEHVIVDVGTGYYVQKVRTSRFSLSADLSDPQTRAEATKHYQKKSDFVKGNLEKLQETIEKKQENMNYLLNIVQIKMQQQQQGKP